MKEKNESREAKVEMTPMIDVVFQLLIFFVVTLKQEDILSRFSAARPAHDSDIESPAIDLIDITVHKGGFVFKQNPVTIDGLDRQMERYSRLSKTATVVIRCTKDSPQSNLIKVLDVCSKHQMKNLSIFSM